MVPVYNWTGAVVTAVRATGHSSATGHHSNSASIAVVKARHVLPVLLGVNDSQGQIAWWL